MQQYIANILDVYFYPMAFILYHIIMKTKRNNSTIFYIISSVFLAFE